MSTFNIVLVMFSTQEGSCTQMLLSNLGPILKITLLFLVLLLVIFVAGNDALIRPFLALSSLVEYFSSLSCEMKTFHPYFFFLVPSLLSSIILLSYF